jgi:hypothetical protein
MTPITKLMQKLEEFIDMKMPINMGDHQVRVCGGSNFNYSKLEKGISCINKHI